MAAKPDVSAVDDLAQPSRRPLTFTGAHRIVVAATKAALEADAEAAFGELTRVMSGVLPAPACANDLDSWARHGLMSGAQAAWRGESKALPPDLPRTFAHQMLYTAAHGLALGWVQTIKMSEVRHGG